VTDMNETHVFLGRDRECGCIMAAYVDDPRCADDVAMMIKNELAVDRVPTDEARKLKWGHQCAKARQPHPAIPDN
jgi:hypothetical protein